MESQPQNPEFRSPPENFHPCAYSVENGVYLFKSALFRILRLTFYVKSASKS